MSQHLLGNKKNYIVTCVLLCFFVHLDMIPDTFIHFQFDESHLTEITTEVSQVLGKENLLFPLYTILIITYKYWLSKMLNVIMVKPQ